MIVSFHPCYEADRNIICAGRDPDENDRVAVKAADAVILPQGCSEKLYILCKRNCPNIFPNYDVRFKYPGKTGQARLFKTLRVPFPVTHSFSSISDYKSAHGNPANNPPMPYPFVFKLDWGGEGDGVFLIRSGDDMKNALKTAAAFEKTGMAGFLVQTFIETWDKTLRVVVIGKKFISYWRVQQQRDVFGTSVLRGARIEKDAYPLLQNAAVEIADNFCFRTGIDLAGFDFIFKGEGASLTDAVPLFLEINYFFGRRGLGGSTAFYAMLVNEINQWTRGL